MIYDSKPNNDFYKLPRRVNDQSKQMSDFNISQEKLKRNFTSAAKSPGPDCLHPRVLYETRAVIAYRPTPCICYTLKVYKQVYSQLIGN